MKQALKRILFFLTVVGIVTATGWLTMDDGGFTANGLALLERAYEVQSERPEERSQWAAFDQSRPPAQMLLPWFGSVSSDVGGALDRTTMAGALALALAMGLVGLAAWRLGGFSVGLLAVVLLFFAPGTLFYARTFGAETMITLSTAFLLWVSTHNRDTWHHGLWATAACLLAITASHDGLLLLIPWVMAAFALSWRNADASKSRGTLALGAIAPATIIPLIAAPLLLFLIWPHLHVQGGERLLQWVTEFYRTSYPPVVIVGQIINPALDGANPGFWDGLFGVLGRIPLAVLALTALGGFRVVRAIRQQTFVARGSFALFGLSTLVLLASLNGGTFYADTDALLPMWPFLAVLSALGIRDLCRALAARLVKGKASARHWVFVLLATVCVGPTIVAFVSCYPMESHYQNGAVRAVNHQSKAATQLNPSVYVPRRSILWINQHMGTNDVRLGSAVASERFRPFLRRLIRFGQLPSGFDTAESFDATHLWVPYLPAEPLFEDVLEQWREPVYEYVHRGIRYVSLHPR